LHSVTVGLYLPTMKTATIVSDFEEVTQKDFLCCKGI
jgi:hypothetical protein